MPAVAAVAAVGVVVVVYRVALPAQCSCIVASIVCRSRDAHTKAQRRQSYGDSGCLNLNGRDGKCRISRLSTNLLLFIILYHIQLPM